LHKSTDSQAECETIRIKNGTQLFVRNIDKNIWLKDAAARIVLDLDLNSQEIIQRIEKNTEPFDANNEIIFGIKPYQVGYGIPAQTKEDVTNRIYHNATKPDSLWVPLVTGTDVTRYHLHFNKDAYIKYGKWLMYQSNEQKIKEPKILLRRTSSDIKATFDELGYYPQNSVFIITSSVYHLKYLLVILNSKVMDYLYKQKCPQEGKIFAEVKPSIIKSLPIPVIDLERQQPFVTLADAMLAKNKELFDHKINLILLMKSKWPGITISEKISDWPILSFDVLIKEFVKQKIKLSLQEQAEWLHYFNEQKSKAETLQSDISQIDSTIDKMVYDLYQLTKEEKEILNLL
jgi:hypothetical protein